MENRSMIYAMVTANEAFEHFALNNGGKDHQIIYTCMNPRSSLLFLTGLFS
jgi:hypothetical protein